MAHQSAIRTGLYEIDALRADDRVTERTLEAVPPLYAPSDFLETLSPRLAAALHGMGVDRLYLHQAEAISRVLSGNDVVISTPTASGKTLCFNVPITEGLLADSEARCLVIHPMKALTNDQRYQLERLWRAADMEKLKSWVYDGDTPQDHRAYVKASPPNVIFTNPRCLT